MNKNPPKYIETSQEELEAILANVKGFLSLSQYKTLESAIKMLIWLQFIIKEKSLSIKRLANLIFGKKTESLKKLKEKAGVQDVPVTTPELPASEGQSEEHLKQNEHTPSNEEQNTDKSVRKLKKGHGRRPLSSYNLSKMIYIPHNCLKIGDKCPLCRKGTLYASKPELLLCIKGQPPLTAEAYAAQGLRCNLCQEIFRAIFPKDVATQPRADISARAIVCLAKYQLGTPLYRLETWQEIMKLPISDSEMWEWTESVALVAFPVHQALFSLAAQGQVIHNDDTTMRVLELMEENRRVAEVVKNSTNEAERKAAKKHRKGIFTTALLSKAEDRQIAFYITGRNHSGENLDDLLQFRNKKLDRPIQACDGSSQNNAKQHMTDVAKCFNHARHNFCELVEMWPNEALTCVEMCNAVFMNDRETKHMNQEERLNFHQKHSAPILDKLKNYCNGLIEKKNVEPNSSFGKAIGYLNNHWEGLTSILRHGNAPLSNNDCERAIKSKVLIRKNSYFYKSCWGAFVGDTLLSIIKTCNLNEINPYHYLLAIQAHSEEAKKNPNEWLPWNYTKNTLAPCVTIHQTLIEEIYTPSVDPPMIPPDFECDKMPLRERAQNFFKKVYKTCQGAFSKPATAYSKSEVKRSQ